MERGESQELGRETITQQILDTIRIAFKSDKKQSVDALLTELHERAHFPDRHLASIKARIDAWREEERDESAMKVDITEMARAYEFGLTDNRFGMLNGGAMRVAVMHTLERELPHVDRKDLARFAKFRFDVNGLKTINDLSSEDNGTEYLRRIAMVFDPDGVADKEDREDMEHSTALSEAHNAFFRKSFPNQTMHVSTFSEGGDEFGVLVVAENPLTEQDVQRIGRHYDDHIKELDVSDLIDNTSEATVRKIRGYADEKAWGKFTEEERESILREERSLVPKDFEFPASASGHGVTLQDSIIESQKKLKIGASLEEVLGHVMGAWLDESVSVAKQAKERYKRSMKDGNEHQQYYARLLQRTKEERELMKLQQERDVLAEENRLQAQEIERLRAQLKG